MRRKLVGGSLVVVLGLIAIWFFWLRDRGEAAKPEEAGGSARSAQITPTEKPADKTEQQASSPRSAALRWALDLDPEGPLTLEGQVLGPDGKGVAKAEVWLGSVPPRTAVTEDDGTFSFDKLVGRNYSLAAKSGALIGGPVMHKLTDKSDPAVIRLAEGTTVIVTVVDVEKRPVAGAEVSSGYTVKSKQTTDAKGIATLTPVSPGYAMIEARAHGYAPGSNYATVGSAGATARLTITLHRGYTVSGRVIDEGGKPIAKARVSVEGLGRLDWEQFAETGGADDGAAITDDKGQFKIAAVSSGTHTLHAVHDEHAPARSSRVTVDGRAVSGVEIQMKAGGVLTGTVVDASDKPVPYATVRVAGAGAQMMQVAARQATTDQKGAFSLRGIARTKLQARAEADDVASRIVELDLTDKPVHENMKLVLDVSGTIAGVVVDDKGSPVAEVQVNAFPDILGGASMDGVALAGFSSATTDGGGNFKITGLPDGAYRLWAARSSAGSFGWGGGESTPAKVGDKSVRITLHSPGGLEGSIVIEGHGTPKAATVGIGWQAPTPAEDGKFELKELDPGTYDVTFRGPDFAVMIKRDVKVEPGKVTDLGTVTVHRGRKISGKVLDAKGKPVRGATVKVGEMIFFSDDADAEDSDDMLENMGAMRSATTDADGHFSIIGISRKATTVAADHATAGRSPSVSIGEGTQDPPPVTLKLRGFGSITGRVTQKGKPLAGVAVTHTSKSGGAQLSGAQTDDQGNFTLKKVPEGTVVLQAMQSQMMSLKSTTVTVQVTAGKETRANIEIPVGEIKLTVALKAAAGAKVDAAQVFLFSGMAVPRDGKQLLDAFVAGGAQGMKFWFGDGKPAPEFDELVAGEYSVCSIPITGSMTDPQFMQRMNENAMLLKVYCKQVKLAPAPLVQTVTQELPSMAPLPEPAAN